MSIWWGDDLWSEASMWLVESGQVVNKYKRDVNTHRLESDVCCVRPWTLHFVGSNTCISCISWQWVSCKWLCIGIRCVYSRSGEVAIESIPISSPSFLFLIFFQGFDLGSSHPCPYVSSCFPTVILKISDTKLVQTNDKRRLLTTCDFPRLHFMVRKLWCSFCYGPTKLPRSHFQVDRPRKNYRIGKTNIC